MKITKEQLKQIIKEEFERTAEGIDDRDTAGFSNRPWQTPQSGEVDQALKQFVYAQIRSLTSNEELMYEMQQAMEAAVSEAVQKVKRDYRF
jgi:hypothetical protein